MQYKLNFHACQEIRKMLIDIQRSKNVRMVQMTPDLAERFHFPNSGGEMNPWYKLKAMTNEELWLCVKLVEHGILGRSQRSLKQGRINIDVAEMLVRNGILKKLSLKEIAQGIFKNTDITKKGYVLRLKEVFWLQKQEIKILFHSMILQKTL